MEPALPETAPAPTQPAEKPQDDKIPLYDRFVLWMFLLGFVFFAILLLGDLLAGLFR